VKCVVKFLKCVVKFLECVEKLSPYKIPKAFICPTVPFIINKKNFKAILKIKRKQREERKFT
jgi:hypothetical protein